MGYVYLIANDEWTEFKIVDILPRLKYVGFLSPYYWFSPTTTPSSSSAG